MTGNSYSLLMAKMASQRSDTTTVVDESEAQALDAPQLRPTPVNKRNMSEVLTLSLGAVSGETPSPMDG